MKKAAFPRRRAVSLAFAILFCGFAALPLEAASNLYFDKNASGSAWSVGTANWSTVSGGGGTLVDWTDGDFAYFTISGESGGGAVTIGSAGVDTPRITVSSGNITFSSSTITLDSDTATKAGYTLFNISSGLDETFSCLLAGGNGIYLAQGSGELTLSGTNTFTGGSYLSTGTVTVENNSALGTGAINFEGSGIKAGGSAITLGNAVTLSVSTTFGTEGANLTFSGNVNNGGGAKTITVEGITLTFGGNLTGSGGITLAGTSALPGTMVLSGTGSSFGSATLNSYGTLQLGANNALPSGTTVNLNGGALNMNGHNNTVNILQSGGSAQAKGTWGGSGSGANHISASFSSGSGVLTVSTGGASTTGVASGSNPSTYGTAVTLTATVTGSSGNGSTPSGTVTFFDGGTAVGTGSLSGSGVTATATLNLSSALSAGTHSITASWPGDNNYDLSSSSTLSQVVNTAALSITANAQSKTYGAALSLGTSAFTPSGLQNSETVGSVTLTASGSPTGTATNAVAGSYTITPSAATGGTFNAANYTITYHTGTLTVSPATLTVTANNASRAYGAANPAFSVAYTNFVNGQTLGTSDVAGSPALSSANTNASTGAYAITNSLGTLTSTNYSFNLVNGTLTVTNAHSTNVIASSANPAGPGTNVTFTTTLSTLAPSTAVPSGTVQFKIDGSPFGSPVTLTNGVASASTSSLSHGYHTNEAGYAGNSNIVGSTNTLIQLINTPPVAGLATYSRTWNLGLIISITNLLTNATDADGDALSLIAVGTNSTNGATIYTNAAWIFYSPPATNGNVTDTFTYTVADTYGATSANTVTVTIQSAYDGPSVNITGITTNGNGTVTIGFAGIPNLNYLIQAATNLASPIAWTTLATNTAGTNGQFSFTDLYATNYTSRYYRTAVPQN